MDQPTKFYDSIILEACRSILILGMSFEKACYLCGIYTMSGRHKVAEAINDFENAALEMMRMDKSPN